MQITTFRMIYLTFVNEYALWPGAPTFRTFQLPELIADTLTAVGIQWNGTSGLERASSKLHAAWDALRFAARALA